MSEPRIRSGSCCSGPAQAHDLSHHEEPSEADMARFGHDGPDDDGYDDHAFEEAESNPWAERNASRTGRRFLVSLAVVLALAAMLALAI